MPERKQGPVPIGYRDEGGRMVEDPNEQDLLRQARELRQAGYSYAGAASLLNQRGFRTRRGTAWTAQRLQQVLSRAES